MAKPLPFTELLRDLLQSAPAGARAQNAHREHAYEHRRCDGGKDADRSKPLKEARDHEAAEDSGEATKRVNKTKRAHARVSDKLRTCKHEKHKKGGWWTQLGFLGHRIVEAVRL